MSEKVIYTGHFVKDQIALLQQLPPAITSEGSTVFAHHLTQEFMPPSGKKQISPGRERTLLITGQVIADGVHAALVETTDGEKISTNDYPHITIATAKDIPPVNSNDVIAQAVQNNTVIPINPPIAVQTVEGYFDGNRVHAGIRYRV